MRRNGFTLVELLVVLGIISILVAVSGAAYSSMIQHAYSAGCASNMRTLGIAFVDYAADNDGQLPARIIGLNTEKWPGLLLPYTGGSKVYVDPGDPVATQVSPAQLVSNAANNSSFFFNGFNDLGAYTNPNLTVRLANLTSSSNLCLLGQKVHGSTQWYMDFAENNESDVLNKTAYFGGSNYTFADGSCRYITLANYTDSMWLVNQSYQIPKSP